MLMGLVTIMVSAKILPKRTETVVRAQAAGLGQARFALSLGERWFIGSVMEQVMLKEGIAPCRLHVEVAAAGHRLWEGSPRGYCNSSMYL